MGLRRHIFLDTVLLNKDLASCCGMVSHGCGVKDKCDVGGGAVLSFNHCNVFTLGVRLCRVFA